MKAQSISHYIWEITILLQSNNSNKMLWRPLQFSKAAVKFSVVVFSLHGFRANRHVFWGKHVNIKIIKSPVCLWVDMM